MTFFNAANYGLRLDGAFLIIRLAAFAVAAGVASEMNMKPFILMALGGIALTLIGLRWQPTILPLGFLTAAALWGGVAAGLLVDGNGLIAVLLAVLLALLDGSAFVSLRCERP